MRVRFHEGWLRNSRAVNRPALIEELEHVPLMRLVPTDLHGADRPDVQAVDVAAFEQFVDEGGVLGDGGDDEGVADAAKHFALRHFEHAGVGAEEFAIGERVFII